MKLLLKNVLLLDESSPFNGKKKNIVIENGIVSFIADTKALKADKVLEGDHLAVSIGWFDMRVKMGEPGLEHKEDIDSLSMAAMAGGFTGISTIPTTNPPVQTKDAVSYIRTRTKDSLVAIYPMASASINNKGEALTEMIDLHHAGAVAFTDGEHPIWHTDLMLKALQYTQTFDGLIINHAEDKLLTHGAQMNESVLSTALGLRGFPKLAEELMVARDIRILAYTGGRLHFAHVSSPDSLTLIKQAKKDGLNVSCDIAAYQLLLDESSLASFDTNYKVNPPLRSESDIEFYWKALEEGVIDVIVSDHIPQDTECKNLEFDLSDFGMIGIEILFSLIYERNQLLPLSKLLTKITSSPRTLLKLPIPVIAEGAFAELTVFDLEEKWVYTEDSIKSKSKNSPFVGKTLKGKVKAVIRGNHYYFS